jgi:hypothetical protein
VVVLQIIINERQFKQQIFISYCIKLFPTHGAVRREENDLLRTAGAARSSSFLPQVVLDMKNWS